MAIGLTACLEEISALASPYEAERFSKFCLRQLYAGCTQADQLLIFGASVAELDSSAHTCRFREG